MFAYPRVLFGRRADGRRRSSDSVSAQLRGSAWFSQFGLVGYPRGRILVVGTERADGGGVRAKESGPATLSS
jgi:hypothetical protein